MLDRFFIKSINSFSVELKAIGLDTAKSVLEMSNEDLIARSELEEETIEEIKKILEAEFE